MEIVLVGTVAEGHDQVIFMTPHMPDMAWGKRNDLSISDEQHCEYSDHVCDGHHVTIM